MDSLSLLFLVYSTRLGFDVCPWPNLPKTCWQGTKYLKNAVPSCKIDLVLLANLFYIVNEWTVPPFFHDQFVVFDILRIFYLFSINGIRLDSLNSPARWIVFSISQFCCLFILYTTKELHALNIYRILIKVIILTIKSSLKTQQRFSDFGTCFDDSNIIISHY